MASGKTLAAAMVVHAWLSAFYPAKVFTTAPSYRQVELALWSEIKGLHNRAQFDLGGKLNNTDWQLDHDWYALGFSTDEPDRIHGLHGRNILFIVDESQGMDPSLLPAIENVMSDGEAHVLFLMNPSCVDGEAYDAFHSKSNRYHGITIAADDTPNVKARKIVVPGLLTYDQKEEWLKSYGVDSDFCRVKVFAEFPKQGADTLIPISWIEAAHVRGLTAQKNGEPVYQGVDVARFGDDDTSLQRIHGDYAPKPDVFHGIDTMETAGRVVLNIKTHRIRSTGVDVIGLGAGVTDRVAEQGHTVIGENVSEKAQEPEKFANRRSEVAWWTREALDPRGARPLALEKDLDRQAELSSMKYRVNSKGQIELEPKDKMKKRIGKSPDRADSLFLAQAQRQSGGGIEKWMREQADRQESVPAKSAYTEVNLGDGVESAIRKGLGDVEPMV